MEKTDDLFDGGRPYVPSKNVIVEKVRDGRYLLTRELVRCGKSNCTKCPHGPYWYLGWWARSKWQRRYIGKTLMNPRVMQNSGVLAVVQRMMEQEDLLVDSGKGAARELGALGSAGEGG